ncbi:MAG: YitT family protein [Lachnospiraceae bacterium]|nr:YitT family protein [Lachnospiraceae bacterium]
MKLYSNRPYYVDYLLLLLGTAMVALGIQWLYDPVGLVTGGFTGISIILKSLSGGRIPLWFTNIVLNIPVFLIAYRVKGKRFIGRTLFGTLMLSAWLYIIPATDMAKGDYVLAAIFGGVISGTGMGLVLLAKATTGGTDMVAVLIQKRMRHYSVVQIMQVIDGLVVLAGLYVFGVQAGLYAIVAIFVTSKMSDALMEGMKYTKTAFIITARAEDVANTIMERLDRGVTGLFAKGMYSGQEKCVLYCVVERKQIVELKDIVAEFDPDAFVIVSDAREVFGEGFIETNMR